MTDKSFCSLLFLTLTVLSILLSQFVMAEDKGCAALRKDLELKRGQLAEYFVTLDKFRDKGERELESLLKDKINDLLDRIKKAEEVTDCGQREASATTEGISPVKTDASEYVTKTCRGTQDYACPATAENQIAQETRAQHFFRAYPGREGHSARIGGRTQDCDHDSEG